MPGLPDVRTFDVSVSSSDRRGVQALAASCPMSSSRVSVSSSDRRGVQANMTLSEVAEKYVSVSSSDRRGVQAMSDDLPKKNKFGFSILIGSSGGSSSHRLRPTHTFLRFQYPHRIVGGFKPSARRRSRSCSMSFSILIGSSGGSR